MSNIRDVRNALEYAAVRLVASILRRLSIEQATALSAALVGTVGPWTKLHKRALANLAAAFPDANEAEHKRISYAMWRNTGRVIAETILLDRIVSDPGRISIVDGENVSAIFAQTEGVVGTTLHLGNWELATWACATCGGSLIGIYKPQRNPLIDRYLRKIRKPHYPGGLHDKGLQEVNEQRGRNSRLVLQHLKAGGHVGLVCDEVASRSGLAVPFFNHMATFARTPARAARNSGAKLLIGCCFREGKQSRFRFEARELAIPLTDDASADVQAMTAAMARQFEDWIREAPEQWMWWLRRSMRA